LNILSINTSTRQYSLAVMNDEILLGEYILPSRSSHFSDLMPSLDDLLTKVGLRPQKLDGLIVALGPGSFTGIRIGLAVAKGLSQCLDIPIVGVPTLLAMASQLPYLKEDICPLVTSRKGEVFTALFRWSSNGYLSRIKPDACLRMSDLGSITGNKTIFIGNDLPNQGPVLRQQLGKGASLAPANLWSLKASSVGIVGLKRLKDGVSDRLSELVLLYHREADIRSPKKVN